MMMGPSHAGPVTVPARRIGPAAAFQPITAKRTTRRIGRPHPHGAAIHPFAPLALPCLLHAYCTHNRRSAGHVCRASAQPAAGIGIFPGGQKQARVDLPALMVQVDASSFSADPQQLLNDVNAAVTAGATAVVLGASGGAGAASLYDAAVQLKELLRGRAALLLLDRTDIATAVEAEGVVLSPAGGASS